ncbi:MAG: SIS domain-containing protein, partial [Bacteroidetes bacterium]
EQVAADIQKSVEIIERSDNVFFVGNGGSNAITSHMMEDYAKVGRIRSFSFTDSALITCFSNDYGHENAMREWLKIYFQPGDVLIAISSSGNSANIVNAANFAKEMNGKVITLSGFKPDNLLRKTGDVNFHIPVENYGIVECYHQVILHVILDEI